MRSFRRVLLALFVLALAVLGALVAVSLHRSRVAETILATIALLLLAALGRLSWRYAAERGHREHTLQAEQDALYSVIPMGIGVALDPECRNIRANPALARILGTDPEQNASKSGPEAGQLPFRVASHDGREIPPHELVMQRAARTGQLVLNEAYQVVFADGRSLDILGSAAPLFDRHGRVRGAVGAFVDVTERRRTEQQLQHAQRLQAVGQLAGGVAHDINNVMTAVLGAADFALRQLTPDHPAAVDLREVIGGATRAADVARQLLAFSRRQLLQPVVLDLNLIVRELVPTLDRVVGAPTQVAVRLKPEPVPVRADRSQLEQILINLAANARDAMPDGGRLTIETDEVEFDGVYVMAHAGVAVAPGPYARLVVTDTGIGMDAETRRRAFEPFFTTKEVGRGTGLGLSMVYGITKQSGGYVWLYSEHGQGTTVKVYLPRVSAAALAESAAPHDRAQRGAGERVLVVEDTADVREFVVRALRAEGYDVLSAADGLEALSVMQSATPPVKLVVSDLVMPRMNGRALGEALRARYPGLPILYTSGYTDDDVIARGLRSEAAPFLQKPFTPQDLALRVRDLLDSYAAERA